MRLQGSYPAMITPFKEGAVDEPSLKKIVNHLIRGGSAGIVACGSTGEAATLTQDEYAQVISAVIEASAGRVPVIAGIGTAGTEKTVHQAEAAEALGAEGLLALCPYYNKPTQDGLYLHFKTVARAVRLPIIVYNIPGRTAVNLLPQTLARLAEDCSNIVAVKEASGSLDQVSEIVGLCPSGFTVLAGDDSLTLPMMAVGAKGVVSVVANLFPKETAALCSAALRGDLAAARRHHSRLFPIVKALFIETNPIPVKAAAARLGLCRNELRPPLTPMTRANEAKLAAALAARAKH